MSRNIGRMDERITFRIYGSTRNGANQPVVAYTNGNTVWASRGARGGGEAQAQAMVKSKEQITLWVRALDCETITAKDHIQWRGRTYNIENIEEQGRSDARAFHCSLTDGN